MVIFHSYVSLPEGKLFQLGIDLLVLNVGNGWVAGGMG